jgi:hypothetical protein
VATEVVGRLTLAPLIEAAGCSIARCHCGFVDSHKGVQMNDWLVHLDRRLKYFMTSPFLVKRQFDLVLSWGDLSIFSCSH